MSVALGGPWWAWAVVFLIVWYLMNLYSVRVAMSVVREIADRSARAKEAKMEEFKAMVEAPLDEVTLRRIEREERE